MKNILIFENTHEAIVDRKTFDLVQKHVAGRKRPDKQGEVDKFAGYVFCGDCGKWLYLHRGKIIKPENNYFQCGGFQTRTTDCTAHYSWKSVLEGVVLTSIKKMNAFAREKPDEFYAMANSYKQEQAELKQKLESITARISEMDLQKQYVRELMENARVYIEMPRLTPDLLHVFIRYIEVYEKEENYSRTCGNLVKVHFTFQTQEKKQRLPRWQPLR